MKILKKVITVLMILISLFWYYVPVYAESATYALVAPNDPVEFSGYYSSAHRYREYIYNVQSEVRSVVLKSNQSGDYIGCYIFFVSKSSFNYSFQYSGEQTGSSAGSASYVSGMDFYYHSINLTNIESDDVPIITDSNFNSSVRAYYYTFGDGAVDPEEPIHRGDLAEVGFTTRIAGNGNAALNNVDIIKWNGYVDSLGYEFTDTSKVQIRAVPGKYTGESKESLLTKKANDFIKDLTGAAQISELPVSTGTFSITWNETVNYLKNAYPFHVNQIFGLFNQNGAWLKSGWVYQYRLIDEGFEGEWHDIYTLTSSGVKNDLVVINVTEINEELINIQSDIDITIIYIDIIIPTIPTPSPEPTVEPTPTPSELPDPGFTPTPDPEQTFTPEPATPLPETPCPSCEIEFPDNSPWYRAIINAIGSVGKAIQDTVIGLFAFDDDSLDSLDYSGHQSAFAAIPFIGDSIEFVNNISEAWVDIQTAQPILHFDGIIIDEQTFVPAYNVNLNDIVTLYGWQQYHELAYTMTDGIIYFSLFLLLIRKIREAVSNGDSEK